MIGQALPHMSLPTAERPEFRLLVTGRGRRPGTLAPDPGNTPTDPSLVSLTAAIEGNVGGSSCTLWGGEPTLRRDLPTLLSALNDAGSPRLGMRTDGLALTNPKIVSRLVDMGLTRVRIPLHSIRSDAHDWLVGHKGAARRVLKAMRVCLEAGLQVEQEITVTRPTMDFLEESVEAAARLGIKSIRLVRIVHLDPTGDEVIRLTARFGLLEPMLEAAVRQAVRRDMGIGLEGFPRCSAPVGSDRRVLSGALRWVLPAGEGWEQMRSLLQPQTVASGCGRCPGSPECDGAPLDYVQRFGWDELRSESVSKIRGRAPRADPEDWSPGKGTPPDPPGRAGRSPATRLRAVHTQVRRGDLGGDPLAGIQAIAAPKQIRVVFLAPSRVADPVLGDAANSPEEAEPTRAARVRLVQAAQEGASILRVASAGSFNHPRAFPLLRDAARLSFERVEAAGEVSVLGEWSNAQLRRLSVLGRVDAALYGPDAHSHDAVLGREGSFEATIGGLERLAKLAGAEVGAYGILRAPEELMPFVEAWTRAELPGQPAFRLAPEGGGLQALAELASELPEGVARTAISKVIPPCLLERPESVQPAEAARAAWSRGVDPHFAPSASDRFGTYSPCPHAAKCSAAARCPGLADGWDPSGIEALPD